MTAMGHFLYNPLSTSLKYDLWKLWAISITIPYHNHWNMSYDSYGRFPRLLINIIEIWPMAAMSNFQYNSLSKSLKYDLWLLWAISFTTPYQNHWNMTYDSYVNFHYNALSKPLKYDLWLLWAISITIPYHNHRNMTYDSYRPFPLQFLIKIIEIWPMTVMGHLLYNSFSKSSKYDLW